LAIALPSQIHIDQQQNQKYQEIEVKNVDDLLRKMEIVLKRGREILLPREGMEAISEQAKDLLYLEENFKKFAEKLKKGDRDEDYLKKLEYLSELITGENITKKYKRMIYGSELKMLANITIEQAKEIFTLRKFNTVYFNELGIKNVITGVEELFRLMNNKYFLETNEEGYFWLTRGGLKGGAGDIDSEEAILAHMKSLLEKFIGSYQNQVDMLNFLKELPKVGEKIDVYSDQARLDWYNWYNRDDIQKVVIELFADTLINLSKKIKQPNKFFLRMLNDRNTNIQKVAIMSLQLGGRTDEVIDYLLNSDDNLLGLRVEALGNLGTQLSHRANEVITFLFRNLSFGGTTEIIALLKIARVLKDAVDERAVNSILHEFTTLPSDIINNCIITNYDWNERRNIVNGLLDNMLGRHEPDKLLFLVAIFIVTDINMTDIDINKIKEALFKLFEILRPMYDDLKPLEKKYNFQQFMEIFRVILVILICILILYYISPFVSIGFLIFLAPFMFIAVLLLLYVMLFCFEKIFHCLYSNEENMQLSTTSKVWHIRRLDQKIKEITDDIVTEKMIKLFKNNLSRKSITEFADLALVSEKNDGRILMTLIYLATKLKSNHAKNELLRITKSNLELFYPMLLNFLDQEWVKNDDEIRKLIILALANNSVYSTIIKEGKIIKILKDGMVIEETYQSNELEKVEILSAPLKIAQERTDNIIAGIKEISEKIAKLNLNQKIILNLLKLFRNENIWENEILSIQEIKSIGCAV
jgi:shikimate kinase